MHQQPLHNERLVLQQLAEGDESAFVEVFNHYRRQIFKVAFLYTKTESIAEEIVQEVFLKVWQNREKLPTIERFQDWLFIIGRNLITSHIRGMARDHKMRSQWTSERPQLDKEADERMHAKEIGNLLREAVDTLSPQQQAVFRLAKDEMLTYEAIAQRLGISPHTVRTHMSRALETLRVYIQEHGGVMLSMSIPIFLLR